MRRVLSTALATVATLAVATPASASLVYNAAATLNAQGFGSAPRDLSVQGTGNATVEGGCVGVTSTGAINVGGAGSCANAGGTAIDAMHDPNGVYNGQNGVTYHNETPPLADNQKFGIPSPSSLGITTASQIGILFNVTDPGSASGVTLNDLTLKFYNAAGTLIGSIDNKVNGDFFSASDIGNGSAGFVFTVSDGTNGTVDETAYVNSLLGNTAFLALDAIVTGVHGGPETFAIVNLNNPAPVPEAATWAMMLVGFGGIGMAMRRRRAKQGELLQIA